MYFAYGEYHTSARRTGRTIFRTYIDHTHFLYYLSENVTWRKFCFDLRPATRPRKTNGIEIRPLSVPPWPYPKRRPRPPALALSPNARTLSILSRSLVQSDYFIVVRSFKPRVLRTSVYFKICTVRLIRIGFNARRFYTHVDGFLHFDSLVIHDNIDSHARPVACPLYRNRSSSIIISLLII